MAGLRLSIQGRAAFRRDVIYKRVTAAVKAKLVDRLATPKP